MQDLAPRNRELLQIRGDIQEKIDQRHRRYGAPDDLARYKAFLTEIGYIVPGGPGFSVSTKNVDPEIATIAGPHLVVPVINARYALNAANARWGSLYDALYGTDAIPETDRAEKGKGYNSVRGEKVIAGRGSSSTKACRLTAQAGVAANTFRDSCFIILDQPQFIRHLPRQNALGGVRELTGRPTFRLKAL